MTFSSKDKFDEFKLPEFFKRVDNEHPLDIFVGLNSKGNKTIRYKGVFSIQKFIGTSCIEVQHTKNDDRYTLSFSLTNDQASTLFYKFCDDLVEESRIIKDMDAGYKYIVNRFLLWKKLFVTKKNILTENEIMGLLGECLFLYRYCFKKYGKHDGLHGWSGTEPTHKDFSYGEYWYEVKTKSTHSSSIRISSVEQLDSPHIGELVVIDLEKMSPEYNGLNINDLVIEIRKCLDSIDDIDLFDYKLLQNGYQYNEEYDLYSYELKSMSRYFVCEDFPRITRRNIDSRIVNVQYEITVSAIQELRIED